MSTISIVHLLDAGQQDSKKSRGMPLTLANDPRFKSRRRAARLNVLRARQRFAQCDSSSVFPGLGGVPRLVSVKVFRQPAASIKSQKLVFMPSPSPMPAPIGFEWINYLSCFTRMGLKAQYSELLFTQRRPPGGDCGFEQSWQFHTVANEFSKAYKCLGNRSATQSDKTVPAYASTGQFS